MADRRGDWIGCSSMWANRGVEDIVGRVVAHGRRRGARWRLVLAGAWLVGVGLAWVEAEQASAVPVASAARTLNVTDEAHLRLTGTAGSLLLEEGPARGALAGTVK